MKKYQNTKNHAILDLFNQESRNFHGACKTRHRIEKNTFYKTELEKLPFKVEKI